jgi:thiol-disulfide isomerase/thioredoxin
MNTTLDPWRDAVAIAQRLSMPNSRLVVVIGAESWCELCRSFRPVFETLAAQRADESDIWLWLDLEDHADFLDGYVPDDLPIVIGYRDSTLTHVLLPRDATGHEIGALLSKASHLEKRSLPDIRANLMANDWAA